MKKLIFILTLFLIFTPLVFANDLPDNVYNSDSLQIHMRKTFYYGYDRVIPDYFEYFQLPTILEFTRTGDCDDFALYSWYYLSIMNYDAEKYVLFLKDGEETVGHAVTVFYDPNDNTYSVFSNQYLLKTLQTNPVSAVKDVYPTWQIILEWHPSKIGYLTAEEVFKDATPVAFVSLEIMIKYYFEKYQTKVLDYVDN